MTRAKIRTYVNAILYSLAKLRENQILYNPSQFWTTGYMQRQFNFYCGDISNSIYEEKEICPLQNNTLSNTLQNVERTEQNRTEFMIL